MKIVAPAPPKTVAEIDALMIKAAAATKDFSWSDRDPNAAWTLEEPEDIVEDGKPQGRTVAISTAAHHSFATVITQMGDDARQGRESPGLWDRAVHIATFDPPTVLGLLVQLKEAMQRAEKRPPAMIAQISGWLLMRDKDGVWWQSRNDEWVRTQFILMPGEEGDAR